MPPPPHLPLSPSPPHPHTHRFCFKAKKYTTIKSYNVNGTVVSTNHLFCCFVTKLFMCVFFYSNASDSGVWCEMLLYVAVYIVLFILSCGYCTVYAALYNI